MSTPLGAKLELHFYGVLNDCKPCFDPYGDLLGSKIFIHGLVPRAEAVRAMQEATVLVNFGNSTAYQLPSKVVEYVMLGKPVLNVTKLDSDSSRNFFSDFAGVCNIAERELASDSAALGQVRLGILLRIHPQLPQRMLSNWRERMDCRRLRKVIWHCFTTGNIRLLATYDEDTQRQFIT